MELAFVLTAFTLIGLPITSWQVFRAMQRASKSGKYKTPLEAMDDQDFWYDVYKDGEGQR